MKKKAAELPLDKLIGIIILVIFLAVVSGAFFRPEKGWLNAIADKAESFARFIPGRDEIPHAPELEAPSDIQQAYDSLYKTFEDLKKLDQIACWAEYDEIPELNKITITITDTENGLTMSIINSQGQKLDPQPLSGLNPCIVAERSDGRIVATYFYLYYINPGLKAPNLLPYMYHEVSSLEIKEEGFWTGEEEDMIADEETYNLDYRILYKHDSQHICFMPNVNSIWPCRGTLKGLRNHCFRSTFPGTVQDRVDKCNLE